MSLAVVHLILKPIRVTPKETDTERFTRNDRRVREDIIRRKVAGDPFTEFWDHIRNYRGPSLTAPDRCAEFYYFVHYCVTPRTRREWGIVTKQRRERELATEKRLDFEWRRYRRDRYLAHHNRRALEGPSASPRRVRQRTE